MNPLFAEAPVGNVRLDTIVVAVGVASPRTSLGTSRVDDARVQEFELILEEDLRALPEPICVDSDGTLLLADGHHRIAALKRLARRHPGDRRFEFVSVRILKAPPGQAPAHFAYEIAVECAAKGPLPLRRAEKRAAAATLLSRHPEWADREIARRIGVDHKTVGSLRRRGISPAPDPTGEALPEEPEAWVSGALARIIRLGPRLGTHEAGIDHEQLVIELADTLRRAHPQQATAWAAWWTELFHEAQNTLEAS